MSSNLPFVYTENFNDSVQQSIPNKLIVTGNRDPEVLLIFRLLSGALDIEHINSSKKIKQRKNYFRSDFAGYANSWHRRFPALIGEDYDSERFSIFIDKTKNINKKFYKNILAELSYFFLSEKNKSYTSSFIFLYRTLEHVSYAFPLIYASKTQEFSKTYKFLKELMSDNKSAGELGFFKKFIETIYKDDPISDSSVDFNINVPSVDEQRKVFSLLKELCKEDMIHENTEENRTLSIKYTQTGSFLITIRNRFFHYMNGGAKNIESFQVRDIDQLFSMINQKGMYWLSTIFLAVLAHEAIMFEQFRQ